ncbi:MAG: hypothetical protein V2I38_02660, partial [Alcanivoracaceae bacterium]|nr:hypothetical protein [Alcanivoracaceae bacterium]
MMQSKIPPRRWLVLLSAALLWPFLSHAEAPAPLSPVPPDALPFHIDQQGDVRVLNFAGREYRLRPAAPDGNGRLRQPLDGTITSFSSHLKPPRWEQKDLPRYAGPEGFERVWLLPGFGLLVANRGGLRDQLSWTLLRANDGVLNPPVPGVRNYHLSPFVARQGAQHDALLAERTLLVFGSKQWQYGLGDGKSLTLDAPVSAAWLFDRDGVMQHWTPLVNLKGWDGATTQSHRVDSFHYVFQTESGDAIFASEGDKGTANVHFFSAQTGHVKTVSGVRVLRKQKED